MTHPCSDNTNASQVAGSFAIREKGGFLMGFASGLSWYDLETGKIEKVCDYEPELNTRPNDGKVDHQVMFVIMLCSTIR